MMRFRRTWIVMASLTLALVALVATPAVSQSQQITFPIDKEIEWHGTVLGVVESISLPATVDRLGLSVVLSPESLFPLVDRIMAAQGDLETNSWDHRIYWRGNTGVRHGGRSLGLKSSVKYELWERFMILGKEIKTRIVEMTREVHWDLSIPSNPLDNLYLRATVTNVKDFPNWLEELLGVRFSTYFHIPLPVTCGSCSCKNLATDWNVTLTETAFEVSSSEIRVLIEFAANVDLGQVVSC